MVSEVVIGAQWRVNWLGYFWLGLVGFGWFSIRSRSPLPSENTHPFNAPTASSLSTCACSRKREGNTSTKQHERHCSFLPNLLTSFVKANLAQTIPTQEKPTKT